MSQSRQTEIFENELSAGWTVAKITATGAETKTVKATPGKVARIYVETNGITVTPMNGLVAAWDVLTDAAELDLSGTPVAYTTSIKLAFSAAGSAWIIYK